MEKSEMKVINLTDANAGEAFNKFYDRSALTFFGIVPEEAHLYRDFFKQVTEIDETQPCYMYTGKMMNDHYGLTETNAYPDDLCIITFMPETFKNYMAVAIPRFQIGGRWFDDVVENNRAHEEDL